MKKDESVLQIQCVEYFRLQYPKLIKRLWAIPNGGFRNIATAVRLKREGVLAGVPDLFLSIPRGGFGGLFIEMKAKSGKLSDSQKEFIEEHEQDYKIVTAKSLDEFMKAVRDYLKL
jgi:hypothetical protein